MISDILVLLNRTSERAGRFAQSLAAEYGAFLTGAAIAAVAPFEPVSYAEIGYDLPASAGEDEIELSHAALARFEERATALNVHVDTLNVSGEQSIVALARTFDLLVFEQRDPKRSKSTDGYIEPLLLQAGRPCLILPYIGTSPASFRTVTVAWDGSASAARALAESMPFLMKANRVELVTVRDESDDRRRSGSRLIQHLARHHIDAQYLALPKFTGVADRLLSHVSDVGSDLLVMGAYDHSRLRERVLGGASREMLRSMTVPVLMSH
jgi:nucleotide-binding universal stress UspA family protein